VVINLKCESDSPAYDQTISRIELEEETKTEWIGRTLGNLAYARVHYPKFAWKRVNEDGSPFRVVLHARPAEPHSTI
jgi:hypothetical protein